MNPSVRSISTFAFLNLVIQKKGNGKTEGSKLIVCSSAVTMEAASQCTSLSTVLFTFGGGH